MKREIDSVPPVLLVMFNRPHMAAQVFEKVRQVRPSKLFLVVDGARPNRPGEAEKQQQRYAIQVIGIVHIKAQIQYIQEIK